MSREDASIAACLYSIKVGKKLDWEGGNNQPRLSVLGVRGRDWWLMLAWQ